MKKTKKNCEIIFRYKEERISNIKSGRLAAISKRSDYEYTGDCCDRDCEECGEFWWNLVRYGWRVLEMPTSPIPGCRYKVVKRGNAYYLAEA